MNVNFLTDTEKQAVISFCQNKPMFEAVKKVLLATIYHQGTVEAGKKSTEFNWAFSIANGQTKTNEQLGQELRASVAALGYLKSGFEKLEEYKVEEPLKKKTNPAL